MTLRAIYGLILAAVFSFVAHDAAAQKYPERRITRQGNNLYLRGDFTGAETSYRRALELAPDLPQARINLGNALLRGEKTEEAAREYTAVATDSLIDPNIASAANYNLGNVALAGQDIDAAIEYYKQALRLNPDDLEAKYNLAYAQKLRQQQNEDRDQNRDQNQDQNGGGEDNQDQNQDQNQNDEGDRNEDQNDAGDRNEDQNNEGDRNGEDPNDRNENNNGGDSRNDPGGEGSLSSRDAEQMLDAMQAAEDDTREKINARPVRAVGQSGKNW